MKILIAGDNHSNTEIIDQLNLLDQDFNVKIHTGDSEFDKEDIKKLNTWICVEGNMDFATSNLPKYQVIQIPQATIFVTHGQYYNVNNEPDLKTLLQEAKKHDADVVVYGHTHNLDIREIDDMLIINPNSIQRPFNPANPTYVELLINDTQKIVRLMNKDQSLNHEYKF